MQLTCKVLLSFIDRSLELSKAVFTLVDSVTFSHKYIINYYNGIS